MAELRPGQILSPSRIGRTLFSRGREFIVLIHIEDRTANGTYWEVYYTDTNDFQTLAETLITTFYESI